MNSFKTRRTTSERQEDPFGSGIDSPLAAKPAAGDLFFHFSLAMRSFQPLTFRRVEAWSGGNLDFPLERILRLDGPHPFVCVVRTHDRLESALSNPAAPVLRSFDRLVMELGRGLARQVMAGPVVEEGSLVVRPSTTRYWPQREPEALCRIWIGATPMEIRFWMA